MQRIAIISFILILFVYSCKKNDATSPVLTIQGINPHIVVYGSDSIYIDPGAVATDDMDGSLTVTANGSVDMYRADNYTYTYTAADNSGNTVEAKRTVIVNAGPYLSGDFSIENFTGLTADSIYNDTITAPDTSTNIICFEKFARIDQAKVCAYISGITITIPSQTVNCGSIPENKTFSGYGTFTNDSIFTIYYSVSNGITEYSGHGIYSRN